MCSLHKCAGAACLDGKVGTTAPAAGRGLERQPFRYFWNNRDLQNSPTASPGQAARYLPRDRSGQKADRRVQGCRIGGELAGPTDFLILPAANRSRNRRNCSPADWSHRPRECRAACRPLIGCQAAKRWFSCNFFHPPDIIVRGCGRIDLVASPPSAKMMANRFGDRQPKRT